LTDIQKEIAGGIINISNEVELMGTTLLQRLDGMASFLHEIEVEIDLSILVTECQASIDRISERHRLMSKLERDQGALTPADKQSLVKAIEDINLGSDIDTNILHSVLVGDGRIPGVVPALEVYKRKGYRLKAISQVYSAFFMYQNHGYSQLSWAYLNQLPNISFVKYNGTSADQFQRMETQWWQFGAPWMWNCHWDDGFICPDLHECVPKLENFAEFTCNYVDSNSTSGRWYSFPVSAGENERARLGPQSTNQHLDLNRSAAGLCTFGIRNCEGKILSPINKQPTPAPAPAPAPISTCGADAQVNFSTTDGLLVLNKGAGLGQEVLANVSTSGAESYGLFVNETGEITILGIFGKGDRRVLWSHPAPPDPPSGPCPTDFSNRTLKTIKPETVNCSYITTARWRVLAKGRSNITGSWCSRLCQADPQYVAAAPRADGECWCATEETYKATIQASTDGAKCLSCPGAPVEPCGFNNTVAIYKWEGDQPSVQPMQIII